MKKKPVLIHLSPAQMCLLDTLKQQNTNVSRSVLIVKTLELYAIANHPDAHQRYTEDVQAELKAAGKEPRKRFKQEIKNLKEETQKTNNDEDDE